MRNAFMKSVFALAESNPRFILITGDLGFGAFDEYAEKYPKQFLNAGVAEQNMTSLAAGMALEGWTVFTYSIGNFSTFRCLEQIRNDVCYHDLNVTVVTMGGGFSYGALGMSHHATEDLAAMRTMPNMVIASPCDKWEAEQATLALANNQGPGYLRLDKSGPDLAGDAGQFELGKARVVRDGGDISLLVTGGILEEALLAAEQLEKHDISCRIVNMHTIQPLDGNAIRNAVNETGGLCVIEEHSVSGGLAGAVSEYCMEQGLKPKRFARVGLRDGFSSVVGDQNYLRNYYGLDSQAIVDMIKSLR